MGPCSCLLKSFFIELFVLPAVSLLRLVGPIRYSDNLTGEKGTSCFAFFFFFFFFFFVNVCADCRNGFPLLRFVIGKLCSMIVALRGHLYYFLISYGRHSVYSVKSI